MSPLTIERIKKANGKVRIATLNEATDVSSKKFAVQVLEGTAWVNVFVDQDLKICEQTIRKATSQVILG